MSEFEGSCRLCLHKSDEKMVNVSKFDDIIALIANLRLVKHPLIPRKICKSCASILLAAAMMRVNCVESNKYFMSYLESKNETPLTKFEAEIYESQLETEESTQLLDFPDETVENRVEPVEKVTETQAKIQEDLKNMKVVTVKKETMSPMHGKVKTAEESKDYNCQNCRLCLKRAPLPPENIVANMKDVINKIMDMKPFDRAQAMIPDKLCDDCLGSVLTASIIADRCKKAYKYFYSKGSAVITTTSCMVCLKDYQNINDICNMSDSTYSYMHYFATRNTDHDYHELHGEKRICLQCMHDLEVANSVRYKNWKAEEVLSLQFSSKPNERTPSKTSTATRNRCESGQLSEDETIDERWQPINPQLSIQIDCSYCLQQFDCERAMQQHIEQIHIPQLVQNEADEKRFVCNTCGTSLNNERSLKAHYLGVHLKKIEAICDICGHIFHSQGKLDNHRVIHFDERNVKCDQCPARFKRLQNLRIHQRVHSGVKPFKCPYCSKAYAHHTDCKRHIASHNVFAYNCSVCQQGFIKKSELVEHQVKHEKAVVGKS